MNPFLQRLAAVLREVMNPPLPAPFVRALDWAYAASNRIPEAFDAAGAATLGKLWNGLKALPGVHQVGHGLATVLGLYRLDRLLHERDLRKLRELVPLLESAGMHDTARKLLAATERPQDA